MRRVDSGIEIDFQGLLCYYTSDKFRPSACLRHRVEDVRCSEAFRQLLEGMLLGHLFILTGRRFSGRFCLQDFAKYVSLNILGMLGISCYILADTFFVANALGATGLAALNLSISIYSIIQGVGLMMGIGGASRFGILKSQREEQKAESVFATSIKAGIIAGFIFTAIGLLGSGNLALILGADASTLPLTKTYLMVILCFAPFFITNNVVLAFVRNDQNPKLSMIAMLAGSFSNIILDYVFMFPLGMGMFGAAFATGLAPIISLAILSMHFVNKNQFAFLRKKIVWHALPDLFSLGISSFIIEVSSAVVLITYNLVILGLEGNFGVAAYGIVANLALVVAAVFSGLAQGAQPLFSKYYGLQNRPMLRKIYKYALFTALLLAVVIYLGTIFSADGIISLFNSESHFKIAQLAKEGLLIYFFGFFFIGLNMVTAMFLSATEKPQAAFIVSILRGFVLIIPLVVALSSFLEMTGVWLAFVFSELITNFASAYFGKERARTALLAQAKN